MISGNTLSEEDVMPVLAIVSGKGITRAMYEALRKEVAWESENPPGAIFHAAAFDDDNDLHAADVWESADRMNEFFAKRLLPAMQALGIPPPDVAVYPIGTLTAYRSIQKYVVTERFWVRP
jgi:hypothetical protein